MPQNLKIPFINRLAPKTASIVTVVAVMLAVVFSSMQIYQDYLLQRTELNSKVLQIISIMKQTAVQSAYLVDSPLAMTVASGLLEYEPVIEVQVLDDFNNILAELKRERIKKETSRVSELLFGLQKKYEMPLSVNYSEEMHIGKLVVVVDPYSITNSFIIRALQNIGYGLVRNVVLSFLIYLIFYFIITRPLLSLIRSYNDFDPKAPENIKLAIPKGHDKDELGTLINISNNLFEAIGESTEEIKRSEEEKRELEKKLLQSYKMEAIGTLAGGIAHDFNNILAIIIGYTTMAKHNAPSDSKYAGDLEKVLAAGDRAKDLVLQILAFSRQTEIERIPIQLQSLTAESLKMLRSTLPTTITLIDDIDPQCGTILADPTQVHQILMNLCSNANHAMEDTGGRLKIELKSTWLEKDDPRLEALKVEPGEYVVLTVSDTGPGISPEVIDRIFDPYFTTKQTGKGTGMGLSIIYGIISNYDGAITVDSEPGQGASFHVYFPVIKQEASPLATETEDIPLGEERVLFIDDEELLTQMGKEMLERLGYQVTVRRNSLEALTTFQNHPEDFDVIITDQTMPEITGAELARQMLQIRPNIPIILCTGHSNQIDEQAAKELGIKEFALKPLSMSAIARLLRKVLETQ